MYGETKTVTKQSKRGREKTRARVWLESLCSLVLSVVLLPMFGLSQIAYAAPSAPPATISRYADDLTGNATTDYENYRVVGCTDAQTGEYGGKILDFGTQQLTTVWNIKNRANGLLPDSNAVNAAKGYIFGWWSCSVNTKMLEIVIGTNNSGPSVTSAAGTRWAEQVVAPIRAWVLQSVSIKNQITVRGGIDMEVGFGSEAEGVAWATAYNTSYNLVADVPIYYNYGDAAGCQENGQGPGVGDRQCPSGGNIWHEFSLWNVSYGLGSAYAFPQIYNDTGANARQWQQISAYSYYNQYAQAHAMAFKGATAQFFACGQPTHGPCAGTRNKPDVAWGQLWDTLDCNTARPCVTFNTSIPFSTDFHWDRN